LGGKVFTNAQSRNRKGAKIKRILRRENGSQTGQEGSRPKKKARFGRGSVVFDQVPRRGGLRQKKGTPKRRGKLKKNKSQGGQGDAPRDDTPWVPQEGRILLETAARGQDTECTRRKSVIGGEVGLDGEVTRKNIQTYRNCSICENLIGRGGFFMTGSSNKRGKLENQILGKAWRGTKKGTAQMIAEKIPRKKKKKEKVSDRWGQKNQLYTLRLISGSLAKKSEGRTKRGDYSK